MNIKAQNISITSRQLESLQLLEEEIKQCINTLLSFSERAEIQVEYSAVLANSDDHNNFRIIHNASFELQNSFKIVDTVSGMLNEYMAKHSIPGSLLIINLYFQKKSAIQINNNKISDRNEKKNTPVFVPTEPRFSFNNIVLPLNLRRELKNIVNLISFKYKIYEEWGYSEIDSVARCVINLYGPPGTGKTMCAHAIAMEVGKKILALNYSEIESKYLGEAAKNLTLAFETAKQTDSLIFFDEADSFLGRRIQNVTQSSDQALNSLRSQMLILLEKFDGIVVFATNLVSNFDQAFMSRIQKHIKFELPNEEQRAEIIKKQIPSRLPLSHNFTDEDFIKISKEGEGLSGREIKNAIFDLYISKVGNSNNVVFSLQDFEESLKSKLESNKRIEDEKNIYIKERIVKKMAEKS